MCAKLNRFFWYHSKDNRSKNIKFKGLLSPGGATKYSSRVFLDSCSSLSAQYPSVTVSSLRYKALNLTKPQSHIMLSFFFAHICSLPMTNVIAMVLLQTCLPEQNPLVRFHLCQQHEADLQT